MELDNQTTDIDELVASFIQSYKTKFGELKEQDKLETQARLLVLGHKFMEGVAILAVLNPLETTKPEIASTIGAGTMARGLIQATLLQPEWAMGVLGAKEFGDLTKDRDLALDWYENLTTSRVTRQGEGGTGEPASEED